MTKLTRFFGTCLLVVSLSAVALADGDGGATQGPPAPVPPPSAECVAEYSGTEASAPAQPAQDSSVDILMAGDMLANWLVMSIL